MIRKFKFEAEIYESLNCLPMATRRKLDAVGIKLHLAQWEQLGRGERLGNRASARPAAPTFRIASKAPPAGDPYGYFFRSFNKS